MEYANFIDEKKCIQESLIEYIDSETGTNEKFEDFASIIQKQNILQNREGFYNLLKLINKISNNHHRTPDFFQKIDNILLSYKKEIKDTFSEYQLFKIFYTNKRNLLFLFQEKIINFDESILVLFEDYNISDLEYFWPEIKKIDSNIVEIDEFKEYGIDLFIEKREKGENDQYICQLIQNDSIDEFVVYVNRANYSLSAIIKPSIFETNSFLLKNKTNLIEYACFYGSIQIFNYLRLNDVELTPKLWLYAIHGRNNEIIHLLEDNKVDPYVDNNKINTKDVILSKNEEFYHCFCEAIKCHHNEIADYILEYLLMNQLEKFPNNVLLIIRNMNYYFYPTIICDDNIFFELCKDDQTDLVKLILEAPELHSQINVNTVKWKI